MWHRYLLILCIEEGRRELCQNDSLFLLALHRRLISSLVTSKFFEIEWYVSRLIPEPPEETLQHFPLPSFLLIHLEESLCLLCGGRAKVEPVITAPSKHFAVPVIPGMKYPLISRCSWDSCSWTSSSSFSVQKSKSEVMIDERDIDEEHDDSIDRREILRPFSFLFFLPCRGSFKNAGMSLKLLSSYTSLTRILCAVWLVCKSREGELELPFKSFIFTAAIRNNLCVNFQSVNFLVRIQFGRGSSRKVVPVDLDSYTTTSCGS